MILAFPAVYVTQLLGNWAHLQSRFIFKSVEISRHQSELESLIDIMGFALGWRWGALYNLVSDANGCLPSTALYGLSSDSDVFLNQNIMYEFRNRIPLTHPTILSHSSRKRTFGRNEKIWGKIRKFLLALGCHDLQPNIYYI